MILHDVRNLEMTKTAIITWKSEVGVNKFSFSNLAVQKSCITVLNNWIIIAIGSINSRYHPEWATVAVLCKLINHLQLGFESNARFLYRQIWKWKFIHSNLRFPGNDGCFCHFEVSNIMKYHILTLYKRFHCILQEVLNIWKLSSTELYHLFAFEK
jgi:hypothetical protein